MKYLNKLHKRGIAIPIVLGAITLMSILIISMLVNTSTTYNQMSIVANNTQAKFLAKAVTQEISRLMYERLSRPDRPNIWKEPLLAKVFSFKEHTEVFDPDELETLGLLEGKDFKDRLNPGGFQGGERIVPITQKDDSKNKRAEILKAEVKFHNFSFLLFDSQNLYNNPQNYYRDILGRQGGQPPRGDLYGFATIFIRMRFGLIEKDYYVTHDIKVVNNEPIAKNYVAFFGGTPNSNTSKTDFNNAGKLQISAREKGRIMIMGPYYLDVEGIPSGTSGKASPMTYKDGWDGLAFMPSPRAIQTCGSFYSTGIERPDKTKGMTGFSMGIGGSGCMAMVMPGDPGYKGNPEFQDYWAASVETGEQQVSIVGPPGQFNVWQGLLYKEDKDGGSKGGGTADSEIPSGEFNSISQIANGMEGRIEGNLIGNYNQIAYKKKHTCTTAMQVFSAFSDMGSSLGGMFGGTTGTASTSGASSIVDSLTDSDSPNTTPQNNSLLDGSSNNRFSFLPNSNELKSAFSEVCDQVSQNSESYTMNPMLTELPIPALQSTFLALNQINQELAFVASVIELASCKGHAFLKSIFDFNFLPKAEGETPEAGEDGGGLFSGLSDGIGGTSWGDIGAGVGQAIQICWHFYDTSSNSGFPAMYSLHSGYSSNMNKAEAMLGDVNDTMQGLSKSGSQKTGGIMGGISGSLKNIQANASKAAQMKNTLSGGFNQKGLLVPGMFGSLPSNFKPYVRTAAKRYTNLDAYFKDTGGKKTDRNLYFDGNLWLEELEESDPVTYIGNGSLVVNHIKDSTIFPNIQKASLSDFLPLQNDSKKHHANIIYNNNHDPETGGGMLGLRGTIMGSVYALQGVKPSGNAMINGNISGFYFNKKQYGEGNNLEVIYNPELPKSNDKNPYRYYTISISPKISGLSTVVKAFGGEGDDGVTNIVDSIDDTPPLPTAPPQDGGALSPIGDGAIPAPPLPSTNPSPSPEQNSAVEGN
ncbi:MAG: hypothetical protein KC646_14585 [Candidatus Cloacimonetes bacterium]|nr:hypothetical protein [Candidatus Cloacimonadota bacterium]